MITQLDNQSWSKELVTGNAQFIEVGSTIYVVSQVRADNTFAVFKSNPTPPTPGPGASFTTTATYTFPFVDGKNNTSFDPVVAYDAVGQTLYIVGTQDDADGQDTDVVMFAYNTGNDTLGSPITLTTASYVRDSYDICILGFLNSPPVPSHQLIAVAVTNPSIIWQTPTVSDVTNISIVSDTLTVTAYNSYSIGQQITFSGLQNALFLNGVTVTVASVAGDNSSFTAHYVANDYTQVGFESGFATWLPGHTLLAFEFADSASPPAVDLVSLTVLDSSPFRSGNTFGAVSAYSPDGLNVEVYYESHPKQITFADQLFSLNVATRNSSLTWLPTATLKTFTGRYADSRLTVIPNGTTRTLLQQFYSQPVHQNALVGNLLLGYFDGTVVTSPPEPQNQWFFHITPGSSTTSYTQGTLSVSNTQGAFVSYLAEPVYSIRGFWSPEVRRYSVNDRVTFEDVDYIVNTAITYQYKGDWTREFGYVIGDVVKASMATNPPSFAFYTAKNAVQISTIAPNLDTTNWAATITPPSDSRFTVAPTAWPLKTAALDVGTFNLSDVPGFYNNLNFTWLRGSKSTLDDLSKWGVIGEQEGSTTSGATYVSDFNVPPVVRLTPPSPVNGLRAVPLTFDASGTNDGDTDPIQFTWTYTPTSAFVTLVPNGTAAKLTVARAIGGNSATFTVGVVAVDYNGTNPIHPPMTVTNISISSNVLTVTTSATVSLAVGEPVFLYNLVTATFLNDAVLSVTGSSGSTFTANFTHADYSASESGKAIANAQFATCVVNIPANAAPTIDFSHDAITHNPVTLPIQATRNSIVTIHPTYTGITDPDDSTTYAWSQVSGTPIPSTQILSGLSGSYLQFETNGVLVQGDTLVWSLTVSDAVNAPVTSTVTVNVAAYPFAIKDTLQLSRSVWGGNISQRNSIHTWAPLDISTIYTNLGNIKRNSVLDGSDRYLIISTGSVLVYGGVSPNVVLLRKLFIPDPHVTSPPTPNPIVDAVHTENDWTLVLDSTNKLYRFSSAPLINTDNPDTVIDLSGITSMTFNKVFTTFSFGNVRIVILTGPDGCLLLQLRNTDLAVQGALTITTEAGLLYGMDNVQFVRASNVESLNRGKLLLGTISQVSLPIVSINITNNTLTVATDNTFSGSTEYIPPVDVGHWVTFSGLTHATFLNGVSLPVIAATATTLVMSYQHDFYDTTLESLGAIVTSGDKTYETLIDLSHGQIIGTWDTSKLKNEFVTTGEILFEPNDTYAGRPAAPVMNAVVNSGAITGRPGYVNLVVSWNADRPDLIQSYNLEVSNDNLNWAVSLINSGYVESVTLPSAIGQQFYFRVKAFSVDGSSPYSNVVNIHT
jgi:hypothetical protein